MRRFELPADWDHDRPLERHVRELLTADRHRSALDEVLRHLRGDPESTTGLFMAQVTLMQSRTGRLTSPEPVTEQQASSALLAPVMTECSGCRGVWCSNHALMFHGPGAATTLTVMNPLGLQCQDCRYTLCRECRNQRPQSYTAPVDMAEIVSQPCPAPGCAGELTTPVLPTGRHDVEPTAPESIEGVVVARDGLIPPTMEEALRVVTKFVPLTADDAPLIHNRPGVPGLMSDTSTRDEMASSLVHDLEREGLLAHGAWTRSRRLFILAGTAIDTDYLITVVRKPKGTRPRGLMEALRSAKRSRRKGG
ncbi:hypothetical protein [Streptomyces sp. BA2]|uniref:hypothetical protein n=1 Tax=Streptomyces sp. BA2 TaxID=436595 RepID=UPI00132A3764|nr:hypothetical protein [Streptomyces sp. BA2]MWA15722.1 hypothetical protein [Streptomyces sp. BA2]